MLSSLFGWLKRFLVLAWLVAMAAVGMWVFWENSQLVTVRFVGVSFENQPLGFVVCLMLFLGALIGYLTCLLTFKSRALWYKRRYHQSQKMLERHEQGQV